MKEIFCAVIVMFVMCTGACAASEDMSAYVRKDVFDAKMETLLTRIEGKIDALSERIDGLDKKIDGVEKSLSERITGLEKKMDARFDGMEKRMDVMDKRIDDTHNFLYLLLVLFGAIFVIPSISKFWELRKERKERKTPFVTVEDVRRIVSEILAENNAKIRA